MVMENVQENYKTLNKIKHEFVKSIFRGPKVGRFHPFIGHEIP